MAAAPSGLIEMIRRNTWIALGLFLVVLVVAVWWTRSDTDQAVEATPTPAPLWELAATDVVAIEVIDLGDGSRVRARRQPGAGWQLEEPPADWADGGRIERAVTSLLIVLPAGQLEADDRGQYGLAAPAYRLRLELTDGSTRTLELGRQAPTGAIWYGQTAPDQAILQIRQAVVQDSLDLLETPPIATPTATWTPTPEATATPG